MSRKIPVHTPSASIPAGPYSPAVIAGGFVFVSGQGPIKPGTREHFPESYPARTTVQSGLPGPFTVEIDVIALLPTGEGKA